jgi:hypothetical protein
MNPNLPSYLLQHSGPVIRYRTVTELLDDPAGIDLDRLRQDLLQSRLVNQWLERLVPGGIHGSQNTAFENPMNKLADLGLKAGMAPLDERTAHFRRLLAKRAPRREGMGFLRHNIILAAGLLRAGYPMDEPVTTFLRQRLDDLYDTCRNGSYDIYIGEDEYAGIPKAFRKKRFLKPELTPGGEVRLPYIHDLYALAHFPDHARDAATARKIAAIIHYVLDPRYQSLGDGYGYLRERHDQHTHHYAIGWSAHLPVCANRTPEGFERARVVQRIELMAHFPAARESRSFQDCLAHLEAYRTDRGTYLFPRDYLREQQSGYWVAGAYIALEDNRRSSRAIELESTFRMLTIKRLAGRGDIRGQRD